MRTFTTVILLAAAASPAAAQPQTVPASWMEMGGSGSGNGLSGSAGGGYPSLAVNAQGQPVVAWAQSSPAGVYIYVRRWDGNAWVEFGGSGSGTGIWAGVETTASLAFPRIALDGSGNPTVVYRDTGVGNWEIHLVRWNGTAWQQLGGSATNGGVSNFAGISGTAKVAVTAAGNPCVAWEEAEGIHVRRWTGSAWESLSGVGATYVATGDTTGLCLRLDQTGQPVLAWSHFLTSATTEIRVKRWNGSAWMSFDGTADGDGIPPVDDADPGQVSLALDGSGYPVVAWHAGGAAEIYVRRWNGSAWIEMGGSGSGSGISNTGVWSYYPDVALLPNGNPIVAWSEQDILGSSDYDIYVRRWNGTAWVELDGSATDGGISASDPNSFFPFVSVTTAGEVFIAWNEGGKAFVRRRPVTAIEDLEQFNPGGTTEIPTGGYANFGAAVLRGVPVSLSPAGQLRMQVEVRLVGVDFTGTPTAESGLVNSGTSVNVLVEDLASGAWHWAARTMSATGVATEWLPFGSNAEGAADFVVPATIQIPPPAPPPAGGGGGGGDDGGGGGIGCGLLGLEAVGFLLLVRWGVRKLRGRRSA